jgi:hypothetical protein
MGLLKKVPPRIAQRAAAENATYIQGEIAQLQQHLGEYQKVIEGLLDAGKQEEAIPYINDAAATEKDIEVKQRELLTYQRATTAIKPGQAKRRLTKNIDTLSDYFTDQGKVVEGPEGQKYATFVEALDGYKNQTNVNSIVDAQVSASKRQLTPAGNAYLARVQARREQRKSEAGGLEAQVEAAKAKTSS